MSNEIEEVFAAKLDHDGAMRLIMKDTHDNFSRMLLEYIDNAVSAGATIIMIIIYDDKIIVADNGSGMNGDGLKNKFSKFCGEINLDPGTRGRNSIGVKCFENFSVQMQVSTKVDGDDNLYVLTWDEGGHKDISLKTIEGGDLPFFNNGTVICFNGLHDVDNNDIREFERNLMYDKEYLESAGCITLEIDRNKYYRKSKLISPVKFKRINFLLDSGDVSNEEDVLLHGKKDGEVYERVIKKTELPFKVQYRIQVSNRESVKKGRKSNGALIYSPFQIMSVCGVNIVQKNFVDFLNISKKLQRVLQFDDVLSIEVKITEFIYQKNTREMGSMEISAEPNEAR